MQPTSRSPFHRLRAFLLGTVIALGTWLSPSFARPALGHTIIAPGYWHTKGTSIVDRAGRRVRIAGVTWYGMESTRWVPAGLDFQPYTGILDLVRSLGYNTVRLPISNQLVESNPIVTEHIKANPQFQGVHALAVLDTLIRYAGRIGLKIILDDHISVAETPSTVNYLDEPLWYTAGYPESSWINDWKMLARRYRGDSTVIGFDLRNEPHTGGPGPWNLKAYLHQGATWGPYGGVDNPATDWRLAAERAGNAVLAINPHLLIFVEGIQLYPDSSRPGGVSTGWWGWNFSMVKRYPVVLKVPHQLVYSPHDWGPWKWNQPWFPRMTYRSMTQVWHQQWSFLLDNARASYAAPILLGEFGTCTNNPQCVDDVRQGNQAQWFHFLLRYFKEHPSLGWDFYALNGTNANNNPATNGLLTPTWDRVANGALQNDLASVQR
jgi:endoglucanase